MFDRWREVTFQDLTVEWSIDHGHVDFQVFAHTVQGASECIDVTNYIDPDVLREIENWLLDKAKEKGLYDESFEPQYTGEEEIGREEVS